MSMIVRTDTEIEFIVFKSMVTGPLSKITLDIKGKTKKMYGVENIEDLYYNKETDSIVTRPESKSSNK